MKSDIAKLIESCDGTDKSIARLVNQILTEDTVFKVGDTVAVTDDDLVIGGMVGKAKIKSFSEDKQYANCEFPDGRVVQALTNTLYAVGE